MGVGLVRSLQPPDILWIHWRLYNFIANTSKQVLFLPPSDAYVRSFLYLLYTSTKLLHKSSERSSLISGHRLNSSPQGAKNPGVFTWLNNNLSWSNIWLFCDPMDCSPPGSSVHGISQATHFLLQGIILNQGSNSSLLYWQVDSLPLSHHKGAWES